MAELTSGKATTYAKMMALADFVQRDIRYVAVELGIGGWQPHPAVDIYRNHDGDCKDKATLMSTMLKESGVESYYVSINTTRGAVTAQTPPQMYLFNHEILAIRLLEDVKDASLTAIYQGPKLGRILIFDPTDELTPLGPLRGELQANYGLLVTADGGELIELPLVDPEYNYTFVVPSYAKAEGELLLVRPRVLGEKSSDILEKKEARKYPVEFEGPRKDTDWIEIALPQGFEVDELPPPADVDYPFGSYYSETAVQGKSIAYTRTFEIKEVSVSLDKTEDLKKLCRTIASDERSTAVLKQTGKQRLI